MQRRLRHFDETGAHDRVDRNVVVFVRFADNLVMHLELAGTSMTTSASSVAWQLSRRLSSRPRRLTESPFGLARRRDVFRRRFDAVLGEVAFGHFDLATTA